MYYPNYYSLDYEKSLNITIKNSSTMEFHRLWGPSAVKGDFVQTPPSVLSPGGTYVFDVRGRTSMHGNISYMHIEFFFNCGRNHYYAEVVPESIPVYVTIERPFVPSAKDISVKYTILNKHTNMYF